MKKSLFALVASLLVSTAALAAPSAKEAEDLITTNATKISAIADSATAYYDSDRARYHKEIAAVLDPVVDFTTFARGVMGNTASARYIQSLPEDKREAAKAYVPQFRDVLYHTVIKSYGKIFYNYRGSKFSIKSSELLGKGDRASVTQQVIDPQGDHYVLQYTLNNQGDQGWKIQNVIVDGVNMGQSYRAQFEAAADRYKGDISEVIKNWPQIMEGRE